MDDLPDGGIADFFLSNEGLLSVVEAEQPAVSGMLETLGVDLEGAATAMTLTIDGDIVSLEGSTGLAGEGEPVGADGLIESFPADSLIAAGAGNVGENPGGLLGAAEQTEADTDGASPEQDGEVQGLDGIFGQAEAFGVDIPALIASLESAGVFVSGQKPAELGGALVATTSDPDLVAETIGSISTLGAFAGGDFFRPLPDGLDGFSVALPGMDGKSGRIVVGSGPVRRCHRSQGAQAGPAARRPARHQRQGRPDRGRLGGGPARRLPRSKGGQAGPAARRAHPRQPRPLRDAISTLSGDGVGLFARPSALRPSDQQDDRPVRLRNPRRQGRQR